MFDKQECRREYYWGNREEAGAKSRAWNRANPEKCAAASKRWRAENPEKFRESEQKRYIKDKEKCRAGNALRYAVKAGKIIRPNKCSSCGAIGPIQGHHYKGYKEENFLDVQWLCPPCHGKAHRKHL
jgi:hypothetical protein